MHKVDMENFIKLFLLTT